MPENRKYLMDKFQRHLYENYLTYSEKHGLEPSFSGMITYIIDQELISNGKIKKYTVINEYECLNTRFNTPKTKTVHSLSDLFNIPERTVWNILSQRKNKIGKK